MSKIIPVTTHRQLSACYRIISQLRPHLEQAEFVDRAHRQMKEHGYRLVCLEDNKKIRSVAGYKINESLALGKHMYIDDLVTTEEDRSSGYGHTILNWLKAKAQKCGCSQIHLDAGVQRHSAHRFYSKNRLTIGGFHFYTPLNS